MQGAQARDQAEAVAIRQPAVQHHGVVMTQTSDRLRVGQGRGVVDDDVQALQGGLQHGRHFRFVLDQQDAHWRSPSRAAAGFAGRRFIRIPALAGGNW